MQLLLNKKANQRVCNLDVYKGMNIFKNFKWKDLYEMKLRSHYKPTLTSLKGKIEESKDLIEDILKVEKHNTNYEDDEEYLEYNWIKDF